jgi:hypothetical protein
LRVAQCVRSEKRKRGNKRPYTSNVVAILVRGHGAPLAADSVIDVKPN